jgi:hypothetical protein
MKETLLKLVLKLFAGISAEQYRTAFQHVANAAETALSSVEKRSWVVDNLKAQWPKLSNWAINWLVESVVGVLKNKQ